MLRIVPSTRAFSAFAYFSFKRLACNFFLNHNSIDHALANIHSVSTYTRSIVQGNEKLSLELVGRAVLETCEKGEMRTQTSITSSRVLSHSEAEMRTRSSTERNGTESREFLSCTRSMMNE